MIIKEDFAFFVLDVFSFLCHNESAFLIYLLAKLQGACCSRFLPRCYCANGLYHWGNKTVKQAGFFVLEKNGHWQKAAARFFIFDEIGRRVGKVACTRRRRDQVG